MPNTTFSIPSHISALKLVDNQIVSGVFLVFYLNEFSIYRSEACKSWHLLISIINNYNNYNKYEQTNGLEIAQKLALTIFYLLRKILIKGFYI